MLSKLSLEADMQQQAESNARIHHHTADHPSCLQTEDLWRSENSGNSPDDLSLSTSGMSSSSACGSSTTSMTSTLEFLHILFPHLPVTIIQQALCVHEDALHPADVTLDETDISDVVDHLLTQEYIRDLVERGLEAASDAESDSDVWITVAKNGRHSAGSQKPKSHPRPRSIPFVDTLQRQYVLTDPAAKAATRRSPSLSADPWTRLTSLAMRLSELLQPTPAGFFMSYFHRPSMNASEVKSGWKAEGDALRDALADLVTRSTTPIDTDEVETKILLLHDIVQNPDTNDYPILDVEQQSRLTSDIQLCVAAARGDSATALDLVWLLRELDKAFDQGDGVAHSLLVPVPDGPFPSVPGSSSRPATAGWAAAASSAHVNPPAFVLPIQPPPIPPPPLSQKHPPLPPTPRKDRGWTVVEPRRPILNKCAPSHAEFIPAYSKRSTRTRYVFLLGNGHLILICFVLTRRPLKGSGSQFGRDEVGELSPQARNIDWYKARVSELQSQRNEVHPGLRSICGCQYAADEEASRHCVRQRGIGNAEMPNRVAERLLCIMLRRCRAVFCSCQCYFRLDAGTGPRASGAAEAAGIGCSQVNGRREAVRRAMFHDLKN